MFGVGGGGIYPRYRIQQEVEIQYVNLFDTYKAQFVNICQA